MFLLRGHDGEIADNALAFSPDGRTLASGGEDGTVRLWDLADRRERAVLRGHTLYATCLTWIPGTPLLASGSWDNTIRIWDAESGKRVKLLRPGESILGLAASPDGRELAAVGGRTYGFNSVLRYTAGAWKPLPPLGREMMQIGVVGYCLDGRHLLAGGKERNLTAYDLQTQQPVAARKQTHWLQGLAVSAGAVAASAGRRVHLYSPPGEGFELRSAVTGFRQRVLGLALHPEGDLLAVACTDGTVGLWDVPGGKWQRHFRWKIGPVHAVAFAPDGMTAAAAGVGVIAVWDVD